ncbi:MAG TPA: GspE/PulE family protein [Acidobacteriota bacterium]|nr:GspE/PulE family protein [Acidobacteriota bacterium]
MATGDTRTNGSDDALARGSREEIEKAQQLASRYGVEFLDPDDFHLDGELFSTIPAKLMYRYNFVPLRRDDGELTVVLADPSDVRVQDELELALGATVSVVVGTPTFINDILKKSESSQRVLEEATEGFQPRMIEEDEDIEKSLSIESLEGDASPIIKLVDSVIFTGIQRRASDIHLETRDHELAIKYRIDGALYHAMKPMSKRYAAEVVNRVKVMSELDISEKRIPQDGRFKKLIGRRSIDFRVSVLPTLYGENIVIRILDKEAIQKEFSQLNLEVLGFTPKQIERIRKFINEPYGMVLVTGPTGSGKTTTLYAALSEIKNEEDKIITIEDPVEYQLDGVTQIPVNEKKGLTFSRGLRHILRHDPDKVMVGEIRDPETAHIAVQSALTGHMVFTTVHANNVVDVIGRLLNMGVESYNFVSALNCVLAQRLVRRICPSCRQKANYTPEQLRYWGIDPQAYGDVTFFRGIGCLDCHGTGYQGREAILEILEMTDSIREMILEKRSAAEIKRQARKEGMRFLRDEAVERAVAGITTIEEINKVTFME